MKLLFAWRLAVRDCTELGSIDKCVAHTLGTFMNSDGDSCFPSMLRIASGAGCSERTARNAIRRLEQLGFLRTRRGGGTRRSNNYHARIPTTRRQSRTSTQEAPNDTSAPNSTRQPKSVSRNDETEIPAGDAPNPATAAGELDTRELVTEGVNKRNQSSSNNCFDCGDDIDVGERVQYGSLTLCCECAGWRSAARSYMRQDIAAAGKRTSAWG
jgi:hypothetical protein